MLKNPPSAVRLDDRAKPAGRASVLETALWFAAPTPESEDALEISRILSHHRQELAGARELARM
jgi:hypothetical protein